MASLDYKLISGNGPIACDFLHFVFRNRFCFSFAPFYVHSLSVLWSMADVRSIHWAKIGSCKWINLNKFWFSPSANDKSFKSFVCDICVAHLLSEIFIFDWMNAEQFEWISLYVHWCHILIERLIAFEMFLMGKGTKAPSFCLLFRNLFNVDFSLTTISLFHQVNRFLSSALFIQWANKSPDLVQGISS